MSALTSNLVTDASLTVANTSTSVLAVSNSRNGLILHNPSAADNVSVNLTGGAATLHGAGSIFMPPGATILLDVAVCRNAITAISSNAGGSPLTVIVWV